MILKKVEDMRSSIAVDLLKTKETSVKRTPKKYPDIWSIPAVDLTPSLYTHKKTKTNTFRKYRSPREEPLKLPELWLPKICQDKKEQPNMITRFRIISANSDRRKALKTGFHEKDVYRQPRPHHFNDDIYRPLVKDLDKEDFVIQCEHDPMNINFKNKTLLKTLPELSVKPTQVVRISDGQFNTRLDKEIKWDNTLLLPKTKYQKGPDPKDIFYDKVEETLRNTKLQNHTYKTQQEIVRPDIYDNTTVDLLEIIRTVPRHDLYHLHSPVHNEKKR